MTAATANLVNGLALVCFSAWGFFASDKLSLTALIPAAVGVALLLCQAGVRRERKLIAHVAVLLTLLILLALVVPFRSAFGDGDALGILRVGAMMFTSVLAMVYFIKSFRDARDKRASG